jgi:hypothetical protein
VLAPEALESMLGLGEFELSELALGLPSIAGVERPELSFEF